MPVNMSKEKQHKDQAVETEEELNNQLKDIVVKIDEAKRELRALRRHPTEAAKGKTRASFIAGKERMIEAEQAAKQLDKLKQQEQDIRAKLHLDNP